MIGVLQNGEGPYMGVGRQCRSNCREAEKRVVITMDGVNAENAGAIFCHLAGDKSFFCFARCAKSLHGLRDPTEVSRFTPVHPY